MIGHHRQEPQAEEGRTVTLDEMISLRADVYEREIDPQSGLLPDAAR